MLCFGHLVTMMGQHVKNLKSNGADGCVFGVYFLIMLFNVQEELGEGGSLYTLATMSGIGNKRTAGEPGPSAPPEKKAGVEDSGTTVETIKLGGVSSTVCLPCIPHLHLSGFFSSGGKNVSGISMSPSVT